MFWPTCRHGPSASPCSAPAREATTRPRSTRRRRMSSCGGSRRSAIDLDPRLRRARDPDVRPGGEPQGDRRPHRRLRQREARHPVLLALGRRRGRAGNGRLTLGFVYDFGAGEEWVAERGHGAPRRRAARRTSGRRATTRSSRSRERRPSDRGRRLCAPRRRPPGPGDGLAGAFAVSSGCRTGRRGLLPQAGALDRHRSRAAPRPRARPRDRALQGPLPSVTRCSTSASARGSSRPASAAQCAALASALRSSASSG